MFTGTNAWFDLESTQAQQLTVYPAGYATSVNEGSSLTFYVATRNVLLSTLYWTILNGTTTNARFGAVSGSFSLSNNAGNFTVSAIADYITEGPTTFQVQIRTGSTSGPVVATSTAVTINDIYQTPTYTITANVTTFNSGSSVLFNVATTNIPSGSTLYWTNTGTLTSANITSPTPATSGTFTITNGAGSVQFNTVANIYPYASKTIVFNVLSIIDNTTVKASATATQNAVTYTVTASTGSAIEGGTVSYTITSTGVPAGTTLYWTNGGTAPAADFSDSTNSGTVVVTST
jgi:surface adhesion protein